MSGARGQTVSGDKCNHSEIINTREDESVCTNCGLVVSEHIFSPMFYSNQSVHAPMNNIHQFLRDIGANACIPDNIIRFSTNYFDKIQGLLSPKFRDKTIAAYALYETLNKFEVPRMAEEIEFYSGICVRDLWRVESNLILETPLSEPTHFVHRFCVLLHFSYSDQMRVRNCVESVQQLPLGNLRCNCLVAVIIYLYCKETEKKITLRKICETCSISATSVHRVIRQLNGLTCNISKVPGLSWMVNHVKKIV